MGAQNIELEPSNFVTVIFSTQVNFSDPRPFQFRKKKIIWPTLLNIQKIKILLEFLSMKRRINLYIKNLIKIVKKCITLL